MELKYREILWPAPAILGFGLVITGVLGGAVSYAISPSTGAAVAVFILLITGIAVVSATKIIKVSTNLKIGGYSLELISIAKIEVLSQQEFRKQQKATELVIGTSSAKNYLKIFIADPADPYQVWYIATRRPEQFLTVLS